MSAQKINLMIANKTKCLKLIDALTKLEIIIEDRKKINDDKILEMKEAEKMIENILKEFKEDKEDESKNKLRFLTAKICFGKDQIELKIKQK